MEKNMIEAKATLAAICGAVLNFVGWKGLMAIVWVVAMAMDYFSGTAAACKTGEWNSKRAREGLWHKGGMIFVVMVAAIADGVMVVIIGNIPGLGIEWPNLVLPLVLAWYILTELGSILENAVHMGAQVPQWLMNILKAGRKVVDQAGSTGADLTEEKEKNPAEE